jgi:hypothetical protein
MIGWYVDDDNTGAVVIFPGGDNDDDDDDDDDREELPLPMVMVSLQSSSVWDGMGWDGREGERGEVRLQSTYLPKIEDFSIFISFERQFTSH